MKKAINPTTNEKKIFRQVAEITNFIIEKQKQIVDGELVDLNSLQIEIQLLTENIKRVPPGNKEPLSIAIEKLMYLLDELEKLVSKKMKSQTE